MRPAARRAGTGTAATHPPLRQRALSLFFEWFT